MFAKTGASCRNTAFPHLTTETGWVQPDLTRTNRGKALPIRYDAGSLASPVKMANGYLRCDGRLTRVGVFPYRQTNGTVRRELRLPQEVFDAESLSSFGLVPLTNNHPSEMLDKYNTRKHQVGSVISPRADDEFVAASVLVTDAEAIDAIEKGKREL